MKVGLDCSLAGKADLVIRLIPGVTWDIKWPIGVLRILAKSP